MPLKLITISGVDGSGKSTQVALLKESLEADGRKVYYFHSVQFSLANHGTTKPGTAKAVTTASWYKIQLRKIALLIDLLRFEHLLARLVREGYTHVLSDRYFYDTLVNILYLSRGKKIYSFGITFLASLVSPPTHAFFLAVSPKEIRARDRSTEQDDDYIRTKDILFRTYAPQWHITTLDGERPKEDIARDLFTRMSASL